MAIIMSLSYSITVHANHMSYEDYGLQEEDVWYRLSTGPAEQVKLQR